MSKIGEKSMFIDVLEVKMMLEFIITDEAREELRKSFQGTSVRLMPKTRT